MSALLRPSPGSILVQRQAPGEPVSRLPILMLAWSIWLFATPLYGPKVFPHWLWPTLISYAVFLLLYHHAYYRDRRRLRWVVPAVAALAFAVLPFNPGAQCYLIYACAFVAYAAPPRGAVLLMLLMLGLFAVFWMMLGWSPLYIVSTVLVGVAVGMMNISFERRAQADAALRLSHEEVRRLAAVAERERIGRDLHDLLGHTLSLVALKADLATRLLERDPLRARREIDEVARVSREALAQVRRAVTGIRAAGLAAELASARLLLDIEGVLLDADIGDHTLPPEIESTLALTLREAITNVQRHACARRVFVQLSQRVDEVTLSVEDNGRGSGDIRPGNGLSGMRERLQALGGELRIEARTGTGLRLLASLPLPPSLPRSPSEPERLPLAVH